MSKKKLVGGAGLYIASSLLNSILAMALVPIVLKQVGTDAYGVWCLLAGGLASVMVVSNGFSLATKRFVAFYSADEIRHTYVSISVVIQFVIGGVVLASALAASQYLPSLFPAIDAGYVTDAKNVISLLGVVFLFQSLSGPFVGYLEGEQRFATFNIITMLYTVSRLLLVVLFLSLKNNISALQLAYALSEIFRFLLLLGFCTYPRGRAWKFSFYNLSKKILRECVSYSFHSMIRVAGNSLSQSAYLVIIGTFGTPVQLAAFGIATRVASVVLSFGTAAQRVFLPIVTESYSKLDLDGIRSLVIFSTKYLSIVFGIACLWLYALCPILLDLWLVGEVPASTSDIVRVLIVGTLLRIVFGIWRMSLIALGENRVLSIIAMVSFLGSIGIPIVLIRVGIEPVIAIGYTFVAVSVYEGVVMFLKGRGEFSISCTEYVSQALLLPLLSFVIYIIGSLLFSYFGVNVLNLGDIGKFMWHSILALFCLCIIGKNYAKPVFRKLCDRCRMV